MNLLLEKYPTYKGQTIRGCCNGSKLHAYGFNWKYIDNEGNFKENGWK